MADQEQLRLRLKLAKAKAAAEAEAAGATSSYSPIAQSKPVESEDENAPAESTEDSMLGKVAETFVPMRKFAEYVEKPISAAVNKVEEFVGPEVTKRFKGQGAAGTRGIIQGGTLGFGDEAMGLLDTVTREPKQLDAYPAYSHNGRMVEDDEVPQQPSEEEVYRNARDRYRKDNDASRAEFPKTFIGGEVLGSAALPVPGSAAVKGAGIIAKTKAALPAAMAMGGAYGLGASEAELTDSKLDPLGALKDTAVGTAVAVPATAAGSTIARGLEKLGEFFTKGAGNAGAKAIGMRPGIANQAEQMGLSPEDVTKLGNEAREAGLIPVAGSKVAVNKRATDALEREGKRIAEVKEALKASGKEPNFNEAAQAVDDSVRAKFHKKSGEPMLPQTEHERGATDRLIEDLNKMQNSVIDEDQVLAFKTDLTDALKNPPPEALSGKTMEQLLSSTDLGSMALGIEKAEAQQVLSRLEKSLMKPAFGWDDLFQAKTLAAQSVNPKELTPLADKIYKAGVDGLTENRVSQTGRALGPEAEAKLRSANQGYALGKKVDKVSQLAAQREQALSKPGIGWLQGGAAATGMAQAGFPALAPVAGFAGALSPWMKDFGKRRGSAVTTHALAGLAKLMEAGGKNLSAKFGPAAVVLADEADPTRRFQIHQELLESNPEYAEKVKAFLEEEADQAAMGSRSATADYFSGKGKQ